jgi:DNA sulfur modification protein DndD
MKLISLRSCNFRQFYGKTPEIVFTSGKYNTTIIHGNNGSGKTTILNAFTWVLYEKFTAAFASSELLINKRAIAEANLGKAVECWVEIQFEHENKRYQLKRKCYATREQEHLIQYSQSKLFMLIAGDDGRWYPPVEQPVDIIERILPESLHQYFFFDGEKIDHIFRYGQKNNIAEDTKELLGVKVLERAIEHLKKAKKTLQEELEAIGELEIKKLIREQTQLEKESDRLKQRQQEIDLELSSQEESKRAIALRILELSGANELQQLKQNLEEKEVSTREYLIRSKNNLKNLLSSQAYLIFLGAVSSNFNFLITDLRAKGELSSGIKPKFIQQLLEQQSCICGTQLHPETESYQKVESWMNQSTIADVEETVIRLEDKIVSLESDRLEFWQKLDREQVNIDRSRTELAQIENELDNVKGKLRTYPDDNIQNLQKKIDEIDDRIKDLLLEQGSDRQQIDSLNREIEDKHKQISKQKIKQGKQAIAQKRIQATQEAIDRIIEVRKRLETQFRYSLEQRVQEIFKSISFTPYTPKISNDYQLSLVENLTGTAVPVAASTGENQILSLSFIGATIDRVREWSQKNTLIGLDSSTFPIVMDSPFGSLDEIYRRQVARSIPQLANQLVVLVTKTQWRGEVEEEMNPYIGQEYVLVYHSPKPDCEEDAIELHGKEYFLVKQSDSQFEYTEIIRIDRSSRLN